LSSGGPALGLAILYLNPAVWEATAATGWRDVAFMKGRV
jgi:hypothetical protein